MKKKETFFTKIAWKIKLFFTVMKHERDSKALEARLKRARRERGEE